MRSSVSVVKHNAQWIRWNAWRALIHQCIYWCSPENRQWMDRLRTFNQVQTYPTHLCIYVTRACCKHGECASVSPALYFVPKMLNPAGTVIIVCWRLACRCWSLNVDTHPSCIAMNGHQMNLHSGIFDMMCRICLITPKENGNIQFVHVFQKKNFQKTILELLGVEVCKQILN